MTLVPDETVRTALDQSGNSQLESTFPCSSPGISEVLNATSAPTILVVEDEDDVRGVLKEMLGKFGYSVTEARTGKEALDKMQEAGITAIDLVLTDLVMPEMEGVELIAHLRQLRPGLNIIAMSGGGLNAAENYLAPTRVLGARATLAKPFSANDLLEAIQGVLSG